jgi:large subunit ribosomal protein L10
MVESSVLSAQECQTLADLPSREVLLGKLLFVLNAPLGRLVGALQSPLRSLASVLKQLEEKKKQPETSEDQ